MYKVFPPPKKNLLSKFGWDYQYEISHSPLESELESFQIAGRHSKTPHSACVALDIIARPCSVATGARNHCPGVFRILAAIGIAAPTLFFEQSTRHHCPGVLVSHGALESTSRACFEAIWHPRTLLEQASSSKAVSFFLRNPFRNRSATDCALPRAVFRATSPARCHM